MFLRFRFVFVLVFRESDLCDLSGQMRKYEYNLGTRNSS